MGRWQTPQAADGGVMPRRKLGRNVVKARELRRHMSLPEALLWKLLRRAPSGVAFRRQHPIGPYVLDFYCPIAKLAIEVDGFAHDTGDRRARDERRMEWLNKQGIQVVRIPAKDVLRDPSEVADAMIRFCAEAAKPLHHPPSPAAAADGPPPHACGAGRSE
jgi:very-short-patch-repair endonuclease